MALWSFFVEALWITRKPVASLLLASWKVASWLGPGYWLHLIIYFPLRLKWIEFILILISASLSPIAKHTHSQESKNSIQFLTISVSFTCCTLLRPSIAVSNLVVMSTFVSRIVWFFSYFSLMIVFRFAKTQQSWAFIFNFQSTYFLIAVANIVEIISYRRIHIFIILSTRLESPTSN